MTTDSTVDWSAPDTDEGEPDLTYAERYADKLAANKYPWGADAETALFVAITEVRRMRAELSQTQSARQREHDERVRHQGDAESLRAEIEWRDGGLP